MDGGIADLESLVPAEFESDVSVLADAIGEMQSAFDSAGAESGDPDATRAVVEDNRDILDAAEEAMENIEHHFKASCE